jgi:8-oxo-dGTP pyrophosphatase MutT (NUDIX family)
VTVQAAPAATILLLRGGSETLEVFMVVRHHQIDFASGALVFPGGKVDPQDEEPALAPFLDGNDVDPVRRALQVCALREAFEECGVLLARPEGSPDLVTAERVAALEPYRKRIHGGDCSLLDMLTTERLRLACDRLVPFAHWVTPEGMPKRFDTHFYLAVAPPDQVLLHDGHESVDSVWIAPGDAIAGALAKKYTVIFPTLRNLEKLGRADTPAQAIANARASRIVTVLPKTERRPDGSWLTIPKEAGYDVFEEKLPARS